MLLKIKRTAVRTFCSILRMGSKACLPSLTLAISAAIAFIFWKAKVGEHRNERETADRAVTSIKRQIKQWTTASDSTGFICPEIERGRIDDEPNGPLAGCNLSMANLVSANGSLLLFLDPSSGQLQGRGTVEVNQMCGCDDATLIKVTGNFVDDRLHGFARLDYKNLTNVRVNFCSGTMHGIKRVFRCPLGSCDFEHPPWNIPDDLERVSSVYLGVETGIAWEFKVGGGSVVGMLNRDKRLTGDGIVYLYPDYSTAILGRFNDGILEAGHAAKLSSIVWEGSRDTGGRSIPMPIVAVDLIGEDRSEGTNLGPGATQVYFYDPANKVSPGKNVLLRDPMEKQFLDVASSSVEGAGRGVFLLKDVPAGQVVGFYNGVRLVGMESRLKAEDRKSPYRIDNDWARPEEVLNIPPGYRELSQYNATLGHLINHSDRPNAEFGHFDHPIHGKIRSVVSLEDLRAGQELFCDYGYIEDFVHKETVLRTLYHIGSLLVDGGPEDYHRELKRHINYIRTKANTIQPLLALIRSVF